MDNETIDERANLMARRGAWALMALVMGGIVVVYNDTPPWPAWLGVATLGVLAYNLIAMGTQVALWDRYGLRYEIAKPEIAVTYESQVEQPVVVHSTRSITEEWMVKVDWPGLMAYVRQPDAVFSRSVLTPTYVDQRFYSPRGDGDKPVPFPELMVRAGAAREVPVNGTSSYIWTPEAPEIMARLARGFSRPPYPLDGGNELVR